MICSGSRIVDLLFCSSMAVDLSKLGNDLSATAGSQGSPDIAVDVLIDAAHGSVDKQNEDHSHVPASRSDGGITDG